MAGQFEQEIALKLVTNFKAAKTQIMGLQKDLQRLETPKVDGRTKDGRFKNMVNSMATVKNAVRNSQTDFNAWGKSTAKSVMGSQKSMAAFSGSFAQTHRVTQGFFKDFDAVSKKSQGTFQGWALSLMFAGMALTRMFSTITKFGVTAFNDISHSLEGTTTGFDMLQGSMKEMGFLVGAALEPVVSLLLPIVDKVSEWVSKNPQLVAGLTIALGVMGSLLTVVGMTTLAVQNGLVPVFRMLGTALTGVKALLGATFGVGLITAIAVIAAAVILFVAMWKTNFGGIQQFMGQTFKAILAVVKGVFTSIKEIFSGLFQILEGIFTGDFDKIMKGFVKIFFNAIGLIIKIVMGLGDILWNVFAFAFNAIKDLFFGFIRIIVQAINRLIQLANKVPGVDIGEIGTGVLDTIMENDVGFVSGEDTKRRSEDVQAIVNNLVDKIEIQIDLDGEKVAESTATRINEAANTGI